MTKQIIIAGLLGAFVLIIWTFLINGIFRFKVSMDMKSIPNEREVYEVLKENIFEPGRYACNPQLTSDRRFPEGEPVFSVLYGGVGHEAAGGHMIFGLVIFLITPIIASWLLSQASEKILSNYFRKVSFFAGIGLLFAIYGDLTNFGIGDYPFSDALLFALHSIIVWTVVGLIIAWRIKPIGNN